MTRIFKPTSFKRVLFFLIFDIVFSLITLYFSYELRFNFNTPAIFMEPFLRIFLTLISLKLLFFYIFKSYKIIWQFFGFSEAKNLLKAHIATYLVFAIIFVLFENFYAPFPRSVVIIDMILSFLIIGSFRFLKRLLLEQSPKGIKKNAIILGVNKECSNIIKSSYEIDSDFYVDSIINIDESTNSSVDTYISNVKIFRDDELESLVSEKKIELAIFTKKLDQKCLNFYVDKLTSLGIKSIRYASLDSLESYKEISIEDLLAREVKDLDNELIQKSIKDKVVLISGAGGSIGSELSLLCNSYGASKLLLVDNSEYNLYSVGEKIKDAYLYLVNLSERDALEVIFKEHKVDIVLHAAAYKHVPLCEKNPISCVKNNILGSKNILDLSINYEVPRVVIISTDKAVRPTNVMGATKRVIELYAQNIDNKQTIITAVRFGNVLGSSGSVIPKFKSQIQKGGPVEVTHKDVTRYFMMIKESCQLVLQASTLAKDKELFILDMGESVKIVDLAKKMISLYAPNKNIEIVFTGLRDGEKLYEELLIDESEQKTKYESIFIANTTKYDIELLQNDIKSLLISKEPKKVLSKIVKEYNQG